MCKDNKTPLKAMVEMIENLLDGHGYCVGGGARLLILIAIRRRFRFTAKTAAEHSVEGPVVNLAQVMNIEDTMDDVEEFVNAFMTDPTALDFAEGTKH